MLYFTIGERVKERIISCKVETYSMMIYRINFCIPLYEFKIDIYKNDKFHAK